MDFTIWEPVIQHPTIKNMPHDIFGIMIRLCTCVAQAENIERPDGYLFNSMIPWARLEQADVDRTISYLTEVGVLEVDPEGLGYQFLNWTIQDKDMRPGGQVCWGQSPLETVLRSRTYSAKRSKEHRLRAKDKLQRLTQLHGTQLTAEELKAYPHGVDLETGEITDPFS